MLTDDVVDAIREAILNEELRAGAGLIEADLAAMLKVSRGPVRQAIFRLQQEGLVTHEPHRGATVAEVSAAATIGSGIFCASPTRQARPPKRSILMPAEGGALGTEHGRDRMAVALADDDD